MASARPKKSAKKIPRVSAQGADKRAAESEAEIARLRAALEERDNDEDDDEPEEPTGLASFDPRTHAVVTHEVLASLVSAKSRNDEASADFIAKTTAQSETLFTGFSTMGAMGAGQLEASYKFGNAQRDEAARLQKELAAKDLQVANMVRASEEARLERDHLSAEMERGRMSLQRLQMELDSKLAQKQAELDAVRVSAAPIFAAAGQGLTALLLAHGPKLAGLGGGLPAAPAPTPGPDAQPPAPRVSTDGTESFKAAFAAVYEKLSPEALACLRAITCSQVLRGHGAPPIPAGLTEQLISFVMRDAGEECVLALLHTCRQAYVHDAPAKSTAVQPN